MKGHPEGPEPLPREGRAPRRQHGYSIVTTPPPRLHDQEHTLGMILHFDFCIYHKHFPYD